MKLYKTKSHVVADDEPHETKHYAEFTSSGDGASKARTRLKKLGHEGISTEEVDVDPTRAGLIEFLNSLTAAPMAETA